MHYVSSQAEIYALMCASATGVEIGCITILKKACSALLCKYMVNSDPGGSDNSSTRLVSWPSPYIPKLYPSVSRSSLIVPSIKQPKSSTQASPTARFIGRSFWSSQVWPHQPLDNPREEDTLDTLSESSDLQNAS